MRILLLTAHSIAAYDDVRMFHDMGHEVFNLDGYIDPANPHVDMRPPLPQVPAHPELKAIVDALPTRDPLATAKEHLPDALIDWADVIVIHHYTEKWLTPQWNRIKHKRVIWRTCGQSDPRLEAVMKPYHQAGLQIVRYSPKEQPAFEKYGAFAGQDALIRFGKYPSDWYGWTGKDPVIGNITQDMVGRGPSCGLDFYLEATMGLRAHPAGPRSEALPDGIGALNYDGMRQYLRDIRVYLYSGTQPASYTLGLIEAMMTGVPTFSIPPQGMWIPELFEGHEITLCSYDAEHTRHHLNLFLTGNQHRNIFGPPEDQRERAIELFGIETVSAQWADFLGADSKAIAA